MINDDALQNRLNAIKNGKEIPKFTNEFEESLVSKVDNDESSFYNNILLLIYQLLIFSTKSFVFGYSLNLILKSNWNMFSYICVGVAISYILQTIENIFSKS